MRWFPQRRDERSDELHEEMESHILEKADALEAKGMPHEAALAAARRSFGNQPLLQDQAWEAGSNHFIDAVLTDLRFAVRQLLRSPAYSCAAILILGIGIGANTAAFTVLYQAMFRTLPVHKPQELAFIHLHGSALTGADLTLKMFEDLRTKQRPFVDISGWIRQDRVNFEDETGHPRSMNAMLVSGNGFDVLGVNAQVGRLLTPDDDDREAEPAVWPVVLSDSLWNEKYHRDPSVIGQTTVISGAKARIVGVTPAGFEGITPNVPPQMFLPLRFMNAQKIGGITDLLGQANSFRITVLGRLREGETLGVANDELDLLNDEIVKPGIAPVVARYPYLVNARLQVTDGSHGVRILEQYRSTLTVLQLLMTCGLLFCCTNVAGLQMARRLERAHEFAVRVALGANRNHLVRQSLAEALLIAFSGAALAVPITFAVSRFLGDFLTAPGAGDITSVRPDWIVFAIAGGFALVCAVAVGVVPVVFAQRAVPASVLNAKLSAKLPSAKVSRGLLTAQITVAFLLVAAGSFYWRTLHTLYGQDLGYSPRHVTEVSAQFQQVQKSPAEIMDIYRRMQHELNAHKDIEAATYTWITQLTTFGPRVHLAVQRSSDIKEVSFNAVGPAYFSTLKTHILQGREFTDEDSDTTHCIVNDLAAALLFGASSQNLIGREVQVSYYKSINTTCRIVGVVEATKFTDIHQPKVPIFFLPITPEQFHFGGFDNNMVFLIRGENEAAANAAYLQVLSEIAPGTGYQRFLPMERQLNDALGSERLISYLTFAFGAVALLLCGIATATLLMMRVQQNIPQIAIRVALGASPWSAAGIVIREIALLTSVSVVAGACILQVVSRWMQSETELNRPIAAHDGLVALCLITLMMLCAGGLPAIRAGTLHPMRALCRDS